MTPEDPLQTTFDDQRNPLAVIKDQLAFYADGDAYRPVLRDKGKLPARAILRDRGERAHRALAALSRLIDLDATTQPPRRTP